MFPIQSWFLRSARSLVSPVRSPFAMLCSAAPLSSAAAMLLRMRAAPAAARTIAAHASSAARIMPAAASATMMHARSFSAKGGRAATADADAAPAADAADASASAAASASAGSSSSSIRRAHISPRTPSRSELRKGRPYKIENLASFQSSISAAIIKGGKASGEEVAKAAREAAEAAKPAAAVAANPIAARASAAEEVASGQTSLELIPGETAFSGQSASPVAPLLASVFRTKSSAAYSPSKRRNLPCSPQKLNDLCRMVRGVSVGEALIQLKLSPKRKARVVAATIARAAQHGVNTHNMERSRLYISELWVGQGQHLKRLDIKARGRAGMKRRYRSNLFVRVKEQGSDAAHYKGVWKHGGRSHNRQGQEIRIGRAGRTITTIQATLDAMAAWRSARGMAARPQWKTRDSDYAKAFRAQGTATDLEAVFGKQKNLPQKMTDRVEKPFE